MRLLMYAFTVATCILMVAASAVPGQARPEWRSTAIATATQSRPVPPSMSADETPPTLPVPAATMKNQAAESQTPGGPSPDAPEGLAATTRVSRSTGAMTSLTCPTAAFCAGAAARGNYSSTIYTSTMPTSTDVRSDGLAAAWHASPLAVNVSGLACPTPQFCVAIGTRAVRRRGGPLIEVATIAVSTTASTNHPIWKTFSLPDGLGTRGLDISCTGRDFCAAVAGINFSRLWRSRNPSRPTSWRATNYDKAAVDLSGQDDSLHEVECPSRAMCFLAGGDGDVGILRDPARSSSKVKFRRVPGVKTTAGLQCPTVTRCFVPSTQGPKGNAGAMLHFADLSRPTPQWTARRSFNSTSHLGLFVRSTLSCPRVDFCALVGYVGTGETYRSVGYFTRSPTAVRDDWARIPMPLNSSAIACPTTHLCVATSDVNQSSDVSTGPPPG